MQRFYTQSIQVFTKINHIHFCAECLVTKDIRNFIRHFLWLLCDFKNMVMIDESLRSTIARLTGWNANAITNAITELIKKGELVRINDKSVKLNHKLANKFPAYGYLFEYRACQFKYTDAQENLIAELKTLIRKSDVPENAHEDEEKREAEVLAAIYDKLEVQSVQLQSQSEQLRDQSEQLKKQSDLLDRLLNKLEPYEPAEVQEIKKTHLEIVRDW